MLKAEMSPASSPILGCRSTKVSSDFSSYLLAASPPSSNFYLHQQLFAQSCPQIQPVIVVRSATNYNKDKSDFHKLVKPTSWTISNEHSESDMKKVRKACDLLGDDIVKPPAKKKKVKFADEVGFNLEKVLEFVEQSCDPPLLDTKVLSDLQAEEKNLPPLVIEFKQPAADYIGFRKKLNATYVSLENVIVKKYTCIGTVKVKNLSFEKNVYIKFTFDNWNTSEDIQATYVPRGPFPSTCEFDTFSFEVQFCESTESQKLEFCVCFRSNHNEYWDSNSGENYLISTSSDYKQRPIRLDIIPNNTNKHPRTIFALDKSWLMATSPDVPYW